MLPLVYEGGQARFDPEAIRVGVEGVLRVLATLEMGQFEATERNAISVEVGDSKWVRARRGGILRLNTKLGDSVSKAEVLAIIADAFGDHPVRVKARHDGIVIGLTNYPLVNQGDAVVHVASI